MGYPVQQSTTVQPLVFFMKQSADHITGATGLTPAVTISKNGGSFASPSGAVSEIGNGWYKVAGNATDNATLGPMALHASSAGADPTDDMFVVVSFNPQDAAGLGLTNLNAPIASAVGTCQSGSTSNTIKVANGLAGTLFLYHGCLIWITGGTGKGQARIIVNDNLGVVASIEPNWSTTPDNTSTYAIIPPGQCDVISVNQDSTFTPLISAIWNAVAATYANAGTLGLKLNTAGSAGDPLTNPVPGSYAAGTAGYNLGQLGNGKITFTGPVVSVSNAIIVTQGDDYLIADGNSFNWTLGATPNLTSATVTMIIENVASPITATIVGAGTSTQIIKFEMARTLTATFSLINYRYAIKAVLSDGSVTHLAPMGIMNVIKVP